VLKNHRTTEHNAGLLSVLKCINQACRTVNCGIECAEHETMV